MHRLYQSLIFKWIPGMERKQSKIPTLTGLIFSLFFCVFDSGAYDGPMINTHMHLNGNVSEKILIDQMQETNTVAAVVMPKFYEGSGPYGGDAPATSNEVERIGKSHDKKLFMLYGMQRNELCPSNNWNDTEFTSKITSDIEEKLRSGLYFGVGELIVIHWSYGGGKCSELHQPIESRLVLKILEITGNFNKPLVIHMEADPKATDELKRVLQKRPQSKIVWAHNCGRANPEKIRELLQEYKNLYCDLANMNGNGFYGSGQPRMAKYTYLIMDRNQILDSKQKVLMEDFPDRFTVGSDVAHSKGIIGKNVARNMDAMRKLLNQLSPDTAKKIAYQNAISIFDLPLKN